MLHRSETLPVKEEMKRPLTKINNWMSGVKVQNKLSLIEFRL